MATQNRHHTPDSGITPLMAPPERAVELKESSRDWKSWNLSFGQLCDLELLLNGAYSPLRGYLAASEYRSVLHGMRLADGSLFPLPICLDVTPEFAESLGDGDTIALRDLEGVMLAALHVEDIWQPDLSEAAQQLFGTAENSHPGVSRFLSDNHPVFLGGAVEGVQLPRHYDYRTLRMTPSETRTLFAKLGWRRIVAYQTEGYIHRSQHRMTQNIAGQQKANLLLHPIVDEFDKKSARYYSRVRSYISVAAKYPKNTAILALLPYHKRFMGAREAALQALVRRNYGCSHFIVQPHHALFAQSPDSDDTVDPDAAFSLLNDIRDELGITPVKAEALNYVEDLDAYLPREQIPEGARVLEITAADLKTRLDRGREVPGWFSFPEVITEMRRAFPPRSHQGFTVFFTGLSGSGKSTIANVLLVKLMELGGRPVTLLDGDIVRRNLSSELGFSREHRDINIRRIGFVASEITKNSGIAICAPIAPYDNIRREVRSAVEKVGGFILVHVSTPLEVCEARDRKGLYAKARAGLIKEFTGISDPYEEPLDADLAIDTTSIEPVAAAQTVINHLEHLGYIDTNGANSR